MRVSALAAVIWSREIDGNTTDSQCSDESTYGKYSVSGIFVRTTALPGIRRLYTERVQ